MIHLPNGCRRSEFHIFPANWKTSRADINAIWYADCRIIDPRHIDNYPKGKNIRIKAGVNLIPALKDRRFVLLGLIKDMETQLENGYNPISGEHLKTPKQLDFFEESSTKVTKATPFIAALRFSLSVSESEKETKADMKSVLNSLEAAAGRLGFLDMPIGDIQVMHIKLSLDECRKISSRFSAKRFNKAKAYISGLYKYLVEVGAAYANMAKAISPIKKVVMSKPVFITDEEMIRIMKHLEKVNHRFFIFVMIFYYSGGRIKELMKLQVKDVNLVNQTYSSYILKGNVGWTDRTIRNKVLPFWKAHLKGAKPNDYVFSKYLIPGAIMIRSDQATRRWTKYVMIPLGIKATFYKLKHRSATRNQIGSSHVFYR